MWDPAPASRRRGCQSTKMETAMTNSRPVDTLRTNLLAARHKAVKALAETGGEFSADALHELAALQTALTAVREEIEAHAARMGWGGSDDTLD
jgi:methylmalonyl-CoA mutase N-terminal domain/subunit